MALSPAQVRIDDSDDEDISITASTLPSGVKHRPTVEEETKGVSGKDVDDVKEEKKQAGKKTAAPAKRKTAGSSEPEKPSKRGKVCCGLLVFFKM